MERRHICTPVQMSHIRVWLCTCRTDANAAEPHGRSATRPRWAWRRAFGRPGGDRRRAARVYANAGCCGARRQPVNVRPPRTAAARDTRDALGHQAHSVDDLNRLLVVRCGQPSQQRPWRGKRGRPATVPVELVRCIDAEHVAGRSLGRIARELNASGTATAHGGVRWWPSTIRAVLRRGLDVASDHVRP